MVFFVSAAILGGALAFFRSPLLRAGPPILLTGFDGIGVLVLFVGCIAAAALLGPLIGVALLIAMLFRELGRVAAHQMLGHGAVRFRLVPLLSDAPISDHRLDSEGQVVFAALFGAAFSLAPMLSAHLAALALARHDPELSRALIIFAVTCGAVNFVALLPFRPFDGGRCAPIAAGRIWPAFAPAITAFLAAGFAGAALRTGSPGFMVLAGIGAASLLPRRSPALRPLPEEASLAAFAGYVFLLAAHFNGGWPLFALYL